MRTATAILITGLGVGGLLTGGLALEHRRGGDAASAEQTEARAQEAQALEARAAELEAKLQRLANETRAARREAAEATATAFALREELEEARQGYDDIMSLLAGGLARPDAETADADAALRPSRRGTRDGDVTAALARPLDDPDEAVTVVERALEEIRNREAEERRAERERRAAERHTRRMDRLTEQLHLMPYQREEMSAIYRSTEEQRRALFSAMREGEIGRSDIRERMQEIQDAQRYALEQLLNPAQLAELDAMQEEQGGRFIMRDGGGGDTGGGRRRGR